MLIELFITFFKIGLFSIGGGYAIIPLIQEQVVAQQQWITAHVFTDIITISQMTPGPLAINTSTFVGMQLGGISGALIATIGCIISGVVISIALYEFFHRYKSSSYILQILQGLKAASLGLIISAAATILLLTFFAVSDYHDLLASFSSLDLIACGLFVITLYISRKYKTNPIYLMIACGVLGYLFY